MTELDFLKLWITEEFVNDYWIMPMNRVMKEDRVHHAKSTAATRHAVDEREVWLDYCYYFAHHLKATAPEVQGLAELLKETEGVLGGN